MELLKIPQSAMPTGTKINLIQKDEPIVDICSYSGGRILCDMIYHKNGIYGAVNKAYVRLTVAKKLMEAQELLPSGYTFLIYDAWRPYEVQRFLFSEYLLDFAERDENADLTAKQLIEKAKNFVSYPDKSKKLSFVHSSAGAVDLTIVDENSVALDMGGEFDDFTERSETAHYENTDTFIKQRDNRRLLYTVMTKAGFTNLPSEWWHYDYGDMFWAHYTKTDAIYASVYEKNFE